eukprot:5763187-Lingulodinium_polyedra.AAC.1
MAWGSLRAGGTSTTLEWLDIRKVPYNMSMARRRVLSNLGRIMSRTVQIFQHAEDLQHVDDNR